MSRTTVAVWCRECGGTGNARGGILQCEYCLGCSHVYVNRATDGGVPDGEREWVERELPATPINPLRLTHASEA